MSKLLTCLASAQPVCGLHMSPSPIRPRARCDRGARSPLAPTVPFSGTHDRHDSTAANRQQQATDRPTDWPTDWLTDCIYSPQNTHNIAQVFKNNRGRLPERQEQCNSATNARSYLRQYMTDLQLPVQCTAAEYWQQKLVANPQCATVPLVAQDVISAPTSQAFVERLFSVCGLLTKGTRNRMEKSLYTTAWLKVNFDELNDMR